MRINRFTCGNFIALLIIMPSGCASIDPPVTLSAKEMNVTMSNGLLNVTFKKDASAESIVKGGVNMVTQLSGAERDPSKTRSAYLDYYVKGVKDFTPNRLEIIKQNRDIAHVAYIDDRSELLRLEYHLIMRKGVSGIYSYVVAENTGTADINVSELRNVYRFNPSMLNHVFSGEQRGTPLLYSELEKLPKVQDETWRKPDGTVYTKYDFASYQRANPFWGVYGHDLGAWLIHASGEYFSGDALKQDLLVHQDAIILNYMTGAHLGTPDMLVAPGWKKFYGPWLLYINQGSDQQLFADAGKQADAERRAWPYRWVDDKRYVQSRTQVSGQIKGYTPVTVVLSSSADEAFDVQTRGYLFYARTDQSGRFTIDNVIPGDYRLSVYANGGTQPGILAEQQVTIAGRKQNLNDIQLPAPAPLIWSIGQADRQAGEFAFGNQPRNYRWQHEVPANLTYDIGQSSYAHDWYYAQTKPGIWNIRFIMKPAQLTYWLNIAFAAASNSGMGTGSSSPDLTIKVNGQILETLKYENDKAIYRSAMRSGRYHFIKIPIKAEYLTDGENNISLQLNGGSVMYDVITLTE